MENLLLQIVKDASAVKYADVRTASQQVHDFLEAQQGSIRAQPHELRERCLGALRLALESHNSKLVSHALLGFQKLLRDDRFQSSLECESEEQWLPSQLLLAFGAMRHHGEDVQVELLRVLLTMACAPWWSVNESVILHVLHVCLQAYAGGGAALRVAATATASQTLRAFSEHLREQEHTLQTNPYLKSTENSEKGDNMSAYSNIIPIIQFLCKKLTKHPSNSKPKQRLQPFYLECLLSLFGSLSVSVLNSKSLQEYMWKEFVPTLVSLLGSPTTEKNVAVSAKVPSGSESQTTAGRHLTSFPVLTSSEAKTVYNIGVELVRIAGPFVSLRPMLESMFHRMLLVTSPPHRLEALRAIKEIMKKPEPLINFGGPPVLDGQKVSCCSDLGLMKLAMDAFVECSHCSDVGVCYISIECVNALLDSLERICAGAGLTPERTTIINSAYVDLDSCDYKGPMTYQTWEKLQRLDRLQKSSVTSNSELEDSESDDGPTKISCRTNSITEEEEDDGECEPEKAVISVETGDCESAEPSVPATDRVETIEDTVTNGDDAVVVAEESAPAEQSDSSNLDGASDVKDGERDGDPPSGYETDSSGSTEGPEEGFEEDQPQDERDDSAHNARATEEAARRQRIPKSLLGEESGRAEQERVRRLYETRDLYAQQERSNARGFVELLGKMLPGLLVIKSSIEADEALQSFASKYCEDVMSGHNSHKASREQNQHHMIVNADGIYLATYSALLLNLKLIYLGFYKDRCKDPPLTEEEFVENVHGSGVLVYLSAMWLAELYQQILQRDYLTSCGYNASSHDNIALINLLSDMEGIGKGQSGCHLLSDYSRLEKATANEEDDPKVDAGRKFARRLLTGCWDGVLEVLSVLLNGKNAVGISATLGLMLGTEGAKEEHRRAREAVALSLDGLQTAARLSNVLNLHSRCGAVFSVLATVSCPTLEVRDEATSRRSKLKSSVLLGKNRPVKLHSSHILSMDVILSRGLELGSHSPDCWTHIFRCCSYLADLEHSFFTEGLTSASTPKMSRKERDSSAVKNTETDELSGIDHTFSTVTMKLSEPAISMADMVKQNTSSAGSSGLLTHEQSVQVLCALSQLADRLFDDAAYKLNLRSLLGFATALCSASQETLFSPAGTAVGATSGQRRSGSASSGLLHRIGDVMLKCVRSGRPLVHVMQVWSVVGLHLMEAACHQDQRVAKTAVTSIHDIVSALLGSQTELPYFHFNEALFKPFENLLCLELCDTDIQDQIIGSICEFVEGCTTEICSGWRPLFGALRAVRAPAGAAPTATKDGEGSAPLSSGHLRAVLDVFEAFLNTDNSLVFANAAVDCILCLLKHIKGESVSDADAQLSVDDRGGDETASTDLCLASLDYIHSCCTMLARMQQMDKCPIFHASNRINLCSPLQFVDAEIPGRTIVRFGDEDESDRGADEDADGSERLDASDYCIPGNEVYVNEAERVLVVGSACERLVTLDTLERPSGVLHVWCLVLEGLAGAMATASRKYQSPTMKTLFDLLQKVYELPGIEFGLYVVNHLLLPMIQSWLRRTSKVHRGWDNVGSQFKQCCGQTTDLVVDYITKLAENDQLSSVLGVKLLLHQLFLVTTECIASPTESISRLGCSCIRHVIVSAGPLFTTDLWEVTCEALERAFHVSLFCARQLMVAFQPGSDNFYGDTGQVKVAAKSDCTPEENDRLKQLAQQVFLLDNQRSDAAVSCFPDEPIDDDRSYIFLLYPSDADPNLQPDVRCVKVPFRSLVVGLLSHQILLQIVGGVLLQGLPHIVPSLANILLQSPAPTPSGGGKRVGGASGDDGAENETGSELPGTLNVLTQKQLFTLLGCLEHSYRTTCDFDCRPGLKFLVQKVARAHAAANLYKQAGASWTVHSVVLLELCLHCRPPERGRPASSLPVDHPVVRLGVALNRVCSRYARLLARKNDDCLDRLQDQPIFFLVAPLDDYMESRHRNGGDRPSLTNEVISSDLQQPPPVEERPPPEDGADADTALPDQDDRSPESARDALADLASSDPEEEEEETATSTGASRGEGEGESDDTKVYHVATQKNIDSVFDEYKKRKRLHAMPSAATAGKREKRRNPFDQPRMARAGPGETKLPSVLKDHEAHVKVYTEMILSIFDFVCQLDDTQFRSMLPSLFPFVRTLVAHANDATLRQTLAEMLDRIASLYHFGAPE